MSKIFSIPLLLEFIGNSKTSLHCVCSQPNGMCELWLEQGEIVNWNVSNNALGIEDFLASSDTMSIWLRPTDQISKDSTRTLTVKELVSKLSKAKSESESNTTTQDWQDTHSKTIRPIEIGLQSSRPKNGNDMNTFSALAVTTVRATLDNDEHRSVNGKKGVFKPVNSNNTQKSDNEVSALAVTQAVHTISFQPGQKSRRIIGRTPEIDVFIQDPEVSRKHCELYFDGQLIHIKDLGSSNGTFLNHKLVHIAVAESDDVLQFGNYQCLLHIEPELTPSPA
jgi:alpha-D-ribose 1-methylphosphonate 5-triphosphate synthase subunit PhnG